MARINLDLDTKLRGTWIQERDGPVIRQFYEDAKQLVSRVGVKQVRQRIGQSAHDPTGSFAGAVVVKDFKKGRTIIAEYPQVLYGPWLEGTSARNQSTHFKGYRIFRQTNTWLRRNLNRIVQDLFDEAIAKLNAGGR